MLASPKSQTDAKEIVSEKNMWMGVRNSGLRAKRRLLKKEEEMELFVSQMNSSR